VGHRSNDFNFVRLLLNELGNGDRLAKPARLRPSLVLYFGALTLRRPSVSLRVWRRLMKRLAFVAMVLLVASTVAFADTTFYNQPWDGGNTYKCDANTPTCLSQAPLNEGWTAYDNFAIPTAITKITDFTYVSLISSGSWADYTGTNWTLFGPNPSDPFGTAAYSGTAVGTLTDLGNGNMMVSVTGLSIPVAAGQSWIFGFSNDMSNPGDVTYCATAGAGDGIYWQQDNAKNYQYTVPGNTAFSVSGTSTPEPSTLIMVGTGLLGSVGVLRRKTNR